MSDNPSKLMVPHMEETNFPVWHPAMEACLRLLGVFHIITGKRKEPEVPDYTLPTPASGTATVPIAAVTLTREERALNAQLKSACKRKQNKSKDRQERTARRRRPVIFLPTCSVRSTPTSLTATMTLP
jgi:hypothetical protein